MQKKPITDFYKHARLRDGRLNKCIDCTKFDVRLHRQENLERIRAYDKMRGSLPHRVAARKEYQKTPAGKLAHAKALRVSRSKFAEKFRARNKVAKYIRSGKIFPWPVCAVPECNAKPEAHHPDYSRPLDVVWLCPIHHKAVHAMARELGLAA